MPATSPESVFDALADRRLLIVSGKGGVGRTTVAALLGRALARRGRRVLVATVGLDDRLAWLLGLPRLSDTATAAGPGLLIQRVVPQVCIREYGALILRSERLASAVFDNTAMRRVLGTVPGLDDFAVLGKVWHESIRAHNFDTLIFDGPATGHLRYCLGIPQAILRTLTTGPLPREARQIQDSLEDPSRVAAVLVGLPDRWPLTELGEMATTLREEIRLHIGAVVINGLWPADVPVLQPPAPALDPDGAIAKVFAATTVVAEQAARHRYNIDQWRSSAPVPATTPVVTLGWRFAGLAGPDDLDCLTPELHHLD